jgi:hypothetical protein
MGFFFRILRKTEFFKGFMNPRVVQGLNEHNGENKKKSIGRELCEYYCLGLLFSQVNPIVFQ